MIIATSGKSRRGCETLTALLSVGGADTGDDDDDEPDEMAQEYEVFHVYHH